MTMKCLSMLKSLSIKLPKWDINVFKPYNHIKDFKSELHYIRGDIEKYFTDWYTMSSTAVRKADIEPSMFHVVGQQQYWSNVEAGTRKDFCKGALTIYLMDHLISEIDTYFDTNPECASSITKFLRRKSCASCFAVLCRWSTITHTLNTLPITSVELFGTLCQIKTHLRATMTTGRESRLALMHIHYNRKIDVCKTINFCTRMV